MLYSVELRSHSLSFDGSANVETFFYSAKKYFLALKFFPGMNIEIWSLGKPTDKFIEEGIQYYFQKTKPWNPIELVVLQLPKKALTSDVARTKQLEEEMILKKL